MTLVQLRYIVAVDTYRHFATAAEKSFVTQPTLSMQIHKLEEALDVLIFDRSKQPVEPTEIGKKIIHQARLILQEADRIQEMIHADKGMVTGEFKLGIIPTVSTNLLPRFLQSFMERYPDVHLQVEELQTEDIVSRLRKDQLDAGLVATPLKENGILEKPLYYEPFMAYVPEGHRLEKEEFVLTSELNVDDMLLLKSGHCFRNSVLNLCKRAFGGNGSDNERRVDLQSGNFETLIQLSKQGFGMTLIPYLTAVDMKKSERKFIKPIDKPRPSREISLIYSRAQLKLIIIEKLAEVILSSIPARLKKAGEEVVSPVKAS